MRRLSAERWLVVGPEFDRALELDPAGLAAFLEELRRRDARLADDVESALEQHRALDLEGFLEEPAAAGREPSLAGRTFGAWTVTAPLGRGGMGSVWLARRSDGSFEGEAAVKLLNASLLGRTGEERFRREASILARLRHPGIAHLLDAGVSQPGEPYIVLERVDGQPIDEYCRSRELSVEERVRLFLEVLDAVAHAHANLIVHRDIKPSNVLVDRDGRVRLLDFGIAKLLETDGEGAATAVTEDGGRALTPEYASPEQVTGAPITTASDVYGLGVLLYVLLSGAHPIAADRRSPADLVRAIVETEPRRLSEAASEPDLRRRLRGDLETIVAKALKKRPAERYPSVTAFADDLRRWQRHEPIGARPDAALYRLGKFVRRNRTAAALSTATAAALLAGLAGTITQARRATRQAELAEDQRNRADRQARVAAEQRDFALRQLSLAEEALDLNAFVFTDAAASGKPLAAHDLLTRAEEVAEKEHSPTENHVAMLLSLGHQYLHQNENENARRLFSHAYDVAAALPDRAILGRAACELAGVVVYFGETDRAETLLRSARADIPETPQYALHRARCLLTASDVARWKGDVDAAIRDTEAARELLKRSTVAANALGISAALSLGESYRLAGRMHEARLACEEASGLLDRLGRGETSTAGTLYNNWGLVLFALGRPLEAERLLRHAVGLGGGLEARPMLLNNLARTLRELRRLDDATVYAERALARARAAGDRNIVGQSLMALAGIYRERGELARAAAAQAELDAMLPKLVPSGHVAFASLAMEHALLAAARGDMEGALSAANRAVAIADSSKQRIEYLPRLLIRRSELELAVRKTAEARSDAQRALDMARSVAEPDGFSASLGRAEVALARVLGAEGKAEESRAAAASALAQLVASLGGDHPETREARLLSGGARPP